MGVGKAAVGVNLSFRRNKILTLRTNFSGVGVKRLGLRILLSLETTKRGTSDYNARRVSIVTIHRHYN